MAWVRAGPVFPHLLGLLFYNIVYSMKSISNIGKKRSRGRPATDATPILVRVQPTQLAGMDTWIENQAPGLTRPEAIRRLIEIGLARSPPSERLTGARQLASASKAKELAGETIDRLVDPTAPDEEKAIRKRRLLKGPEEFREVRVDRAKAKK